MPQVSPRLNYISHSALQVFDLGEAAVSFSIPQDLDVSYAGARVGAREVGTAAAGLDGDGEDAACGGLEGDLAEGGGECGEEFLGVLATGVS
ncbi:hypothetical protein E4U44_003617 [Claviceps purpurea]|nr:hypothetical protein E4U44_003617 [Claviceps purpurea]